MSAFIYLIVMSSYIIIIDILCSKSNVYVVQAYNTIKSYIAYHGII